MPESRLTGVLDCLWIPEARLTPRRRRAGVLRSVIDTEEVACCKTTRLLDYAPGGHTRRGHERVLFETIGRARALQSKTRLEVTPPPPLEHDSSKCGGGGDVWRLIRPADRVKEWVSERVHHRLILRERARGKRGSPDSCSRGRRITLNRLFRYESWLFFLFFLLVGFNSSPHYSHNIIRL